MDVAVFHRPEVKIDEGLSVGDVMRIISLILKDQFKRDEVYKFCMENREWDIMISDGYRDPKNRTACFVVKGSPAKLYGAMDFREGYFAYWQVITNFGKYYWTGKVLKKRKPRDS